MGKTQSKAKRFIITLIRTYQMLVSPYFGQNCRFYPSCSSYAVSAITEKGVVAGCGLTFMRLLKCHPFSKGGYDPV